MRTLWQLVTRCWRPAEVTVQVTLAGAPSVTGGSRSGNDERRAF